MNLLSLSYSNLPNEAGCDEAGRGCLAGPVFAAAVIWPADVTHDLINDSKALNPSKRSKARQIIEQEAIGWAVASVDHEEIDRINILQASFKAMRLALDRLNPAPDFILVDGNRFTGWNDVPYKCIVKGDALFYSIAAASILAKTHRDEFMMLAHEQYPHYGWDHNKGYPTPQHLEAIRQHGLSPIHRLSFRSGEQLRLPLTW